MFLIKLKHREKKSFAQEKIGKHKISQMTIRKHEAVYKKTS